MPNKCKKYIKKDSIEQQFYSSSSSDESNAAELFKTIDKGFNKLHKLKNGELNADKNGQVTTDWHFVYTATLLAFCTSLQFSIYFTSMWPYFQILDHHADETSFGYIVAIYSLGQILSAPIIGYLSNRMENMAPLLYICTLLMFFGNCLYISVNSFDHHKRKYLLGFARLIVGIGSSYIAPIRSHVSMASTERDRSKAIALVTGGGALGYTMGPAFQLLFTPFDHPGIALVGGHQYKVFLSMYTAPAFFACIVNLLSAICIKVLFCKSYAVADVHQQNETADRNDALPKYDVFAAFLCYVTRFVQMFVYINFGSMGTAWAMTMFAWKRKEALKYFAIAQLFMSIFDFLTYAMFIAFGTKRGIDYRLNVICTLVALLLFHLLTYSYPFLPGHVHSFTHSDPSHEPVGCDRDKFDWCATVRPFPPLYYFTCFVLLVGLAVPMANIALNTLFTMIIGPRKQGTQQGLFHVSGGLARMVGPILISSLYSSSGVQGVWMMQMALIEFTLMCWVLFFNRMVSLRPNHPFYNRYSRLK
uniref:Major facilitator superfamily (MFS) profile domain-containing protein n=1 Tax=Globodera rostochiensis TaxID=31243 RepID=A0A914HPF8_GLORO